MTSYVRNTINLSCAKILLTSVIIGMRVSSHNVVICFAANFTGGDKVKELTSEDSGVLGCDSLLMGVWFMTVGTIRVAAPMKTKALWSFIFLEPPSQ